MFKHELAMQKLRGVPHLWDGELYIKFIMLRIDRTILFGAPRICIANICHLIDMVVSIERFQNLYIIYILKNGCFTQTTQGIGGDFKDLPTLSPGTFG